MQFIGYKVVGRAEFIVKAARVGFENVAVGAERDCIAYKWQ